MKKTAHKAVMLRLDPEVYEEVAAIAKAELRSITAQVEIILKNYIKNLKKSGVKKDAP